MVGHLEVLLDVSAAGLSLEADAGPAGEVQERETDSSGVFDLLPFLEQFDVSCPFRQDQSELESLGDYPVKFVPQGKLGKLVVVIIMEQEPLGR